MRYLNQLEPDALINHFLHYPPHDFKAWVSPGGIPAFSATYDLLTTMEPHVRNLIMRIPGYSFWGNWFKPYTCFIGTTVSEYALFPAILSTENTMQEIVDQYAKHYSFLIIKDVPQSSLLLDEDENHYAASLIQLAKKCGFVSVEGQALAWVHINFSSIDEYIQRFSRSRRKDFKRKLNAKESLRIDICNTGSDFFEKQGNIDDFYQLYTNVYEQSDIHFDVLTKSFFSRLLQEKSNQGIVFTYYENDELIGYNICFVQNSYLIDKYVGFRYPQARDKNLYFISWFVNLQYALDKGLTHYVAGWTDPEVKKSLGAEFTFTTHLVHVRNPVLRTMLKPFAFLFERDAATLNMNEKLEATL